MRRERWNAAAVITVAAIAAAAFFGSMQIADVQAQRTGYVEKRMVSTGTATGNSAFANQLAPNPENGMCLQYDVDNRVVWGPCGLPSGSPGQVASIVALTATRTVVLTGTQTSTGTETYSYTTSATGTTTGTVTATGATGTYTYTATGTSTGMSTAGSVDTNAAGNPRNVLVTGMSDTVFVTDYTASSLYQIDVSTPGSPTILYTVSTCTNPRGLARVGSFILVVCSGSDGQLQLWEPFYNASPTHRTNLTLNGAPYSVAVFGPTTNGTNKIAVVANNSDNKLQVVSVNTDTYALTSRGSVTVRGNPWEVAVSGSTSDAYVSNNGESSAQIVSVSDPNSPTVTKTITTEANPQGVFAWGNYFAVASYSAHTVQIVDATTPSSASVIGSVTVNNYPWFLTGKGAYLYVDSADGTVQAISVATPSSPSVLSPSVNVGAAPRGMGRSGDYLAVAVFTDKKIKLVDVSRYLTPTGTQTTTGTHSVTGTVTNTQTVTTTGTHTLTGTGVYTSSATGVGTSTNTGYRAEWRPTESVLGSYYLAVVGGEGSFPGAIKTDELRRGGVPSIENTTYSANCSSGSDGLIGEFTTSDQFPASNGPVWPAGMWAAHIKASSTGPASIRVVVREESAGEWFSFNTEAFNTPAPTVVHGTTMKESRIPSDSAHDVYFLLYAVCSSPATVKFYSDSLFDSRIETPLHTYRTAASQIRCSSGETVDSALSTLAAKPRATRYAWIPASEFANVDTLSSGTLGSGTTYTRHLVMPDGADSRVYGYLWKIPADFGGSSLGITFRPFWVPLTTDASWNHKTSWTVNYLQILDVGTGINIADAGTTIHWDGDTSWSHYGTAGFSSAGVMLEAGSWGITLTGYPTYLRISVGREHSIGSDTYVGNVGFLGLQIDYSSVL